MKTTIVLLAAAGTGLAQTPSGLPACATSCVASAIASAGCGRDDLGCQCGPAKSDIVIKAVPCLRAACPPTALLHIQSAASEACSRYSATASPTVILASIPSSIYFRPSGAHPTSQHTMIGPVVTGMPSEVRPSYSYSVIAPVETIKQSEAGPSSSNTTIAPVETVPSMKTAAPTAPSGEHGAVRNSSIPASVATAGVAPAGVATAGAAAVDRLVLVTAGVIGGVMVLVGLL